MKDVCLNTMRILWPRMRYPYHVYGNVGTEGSLIILRFPILHLEESQSH